MGGFEKFCWAVTALASIAAAALLATAYLGHAAGAPQETAFAAIGLAVIPYVFARAVQAIGQAARREQAEAHPPAVAEPQETQLGPSLPAGLESEPTWSAPAAEEVDPKLLEKDSAESLAAPPVRRRGGLFRAEFPPAEPRAWKEDAVEILGTEPILAGSSAPELRGSRTLRAEPAFGTAGEERVGEPLVARDRLVEPPPKAKRDGMGRLFWILVGILVVLLGVAAFLFLGGL